MDGVGLVDAGVQVTTVEPLPLVGERRGSWRRIAVTEALGENGVDVLRHVGASAGVEPERARATTAPRLGRDVGAAGHGGFEDGQGTVSLLVAQLVDEGVQSLLGRHRRSTTSRPRRGQCPRLRVNDSSRGRQVGRARRGIARQPPSATRCPLRSAASQLDSASSWGAAGRACCGRTGEVVVHGVVHETPRDEAQPGGTVETTAGAVGGVAWPMGRARRCRRCP